jgi:hypothetical protein
MSRMIPIVAGVLILLSVQPLKAQVGADVLAYLPAETDVIAVFKSKEIAQTELIKKVGGDLLKDLLKASRQASDAITASGLDPMKDFDAITIAIDLDQPGNPKPFAVFEGKYDIAKVTASIAEFMKKNPNQVEAVSVAGLAAYRVKGPDAKQDMYTALIDGSRIVVAPTQKNLEDAFDAAAGKRKSAISKDLANLMATAKTTAPIGVWGWVKGKLGDLNLPNAQLRERVKGIDWMSASVEIGKDLKINVGISTPNAEAAKQIADLLGGMIVLFKLQVTALVEEQPELLPVLELVRTTKVAPNGRYVTGFATVKGETIEKAVKAGILPKK